MASVYNREKRPNQDEAAIVDSGETVDSYCTVKHFMSETYGKYGKGNLDTQMIMEFNGWFNYVINNNVYFPTSLS